MSVRSLAGRLGPVLTGLICASTIVACGDDGDDSGGDGDSGTAGVEFVSADVERPFEYRRNWFYLAFAAVALADILQTALRGDLFKPWYYLVYLGHFLVAIFLALLIVTPKFHRFLAWFLFIGVVLWCFIVRRFLT